MGYNDFKILIRRITMALNRSNIKTSKHPKSKVR